MITNLFDMDDDLASLAEFLREHALPDPTDLEYPYKGIRCYWHIADIEIEATWYPTHQFLSNGFEKEVRWGHRWQLDDGRLKERLRELEARLTPRG